MSEMDIPTSDGVVPDGYDMTDNRPLAVRRDRRSNPVTSYEEAPLTPKPHAKSKKRSRHSEPVPARSPNTGLTPALKRSRMQTPAGAPKSKSKSAPRRQTMPPTISHDAAVLPPVEAPVEIQFAPIRQILSPRTRRRMKRMGLSEEMNKQHENVRFFEKQADRIAQLEAELVVARQQAEEAKKAQRPSDSFMRAQELESELHSAQQELAAQNPDPATTLPPYQSGDGDNNAEDAPGSPAPTEPFSDDHYETMAHGNVPPLPGHDDDKHVGVQTEPVSPSVRSSDSRVATRNSFLVRARMELERITPGETALPLQPSKEEGAAPLVTALLDHLRKVNQKLAAKDSSLQSIIDQEQNLRRQFDAALTNTDDARARVQKLAKKLTEMIQWYNASRRQAEDYWGQLKGARADLAVNKEELAEAQQEAEDSRKGTERLSATLSDVQRDLDNYQNMIFELEEKHRVEIEKVKTEHLKAYNDLEAQLEETMFDHEQAISDANLKTEVIRQHRDELQKTVHGKQHFIREVEQRLENEQENRQQAVGRLSVELAFTMSKVSDLEEQIKTDKKRARASVKSFINKVRKAGEEAVLEIGEEDTLSNPSGGLITPDVNLGHFPNAMSDHVDGRVEMHRGKAAKKRRLNPDSGIGILEEEEEQSTSHFLSDDA